MKIDLPRDKSITLTDDQYSRLMLLLGMGFGCAIEFGLRKETVLDLFETIWKQNEASEKIEP
jgi:hypothetical protein